MRVARAFQFPEEKWKLREKAKRVEILSLFLLMTTAVLVYITHGSSQAMKTVFTGDLLAMIPPISALFAYRYELRPANKRFPWGYYRSVAVAFLSTATAHVMLGSWLFLDAVMKLLKKERPPVGMFEIAGHQFWAGYAMLFALIYSIIVCTTMAKLKMPIAEKLHDKVLQADADLNKGDRLSESAAILGILGIGFGLWFADSAAAAFVSLEIIRDGVSNLREVIRDLMDETPTEMEDGKSLEKLPIELKEAAEKMSWIREASVRLREQGHVLTGDVFVVPRDAAVTVSQVEESSAALEKLDWRLHGLQIVLVSSL